MLYSNMSEKFTALQLADALSLTFPGNLGVDKAAAELRRLSAVNAELLAAAKLALSIIGFGKEHDAIRAAIARATEE